MWIASPTWFLARWALLTIGSLPRILDHQRIDPELMPEAVGDSVARIRSAAHIGPRQLFVWVVETPEGPKVGEVVK